MNRAYYEGGVQNPYALLRQDADNTDLKVTGPIVLRTESTLFGTYEIIDPRGSRRRKTNQLTEAEFNALQTAWNAINTNTGGITINGTTADVQELIDMIGREMARSATFRNLIVQITQDTAHPFSVDAGRGNADFGDEFATDALDLDDLQWFSDMPRPGAEFMATQGEILLHILAERRHAALHPLPSRATATDAAIRFNNAHNNALASGGPQEGYRKERGQKGRIKDVSSASTLSGTADVLFKDTSGNVATYRIDGSSGYKVLVGIEYRSKKAPKGVPPVNVRSNNAVVTVSSTAAVDEQIELMIGGVTKTISFPYSAVGSGNPRAVAGPLWDLAPSGNYLIIQVSKQNGPGVPDTVIANFQWPAPFAPMSNHVIVAGVTYDFDLQLQLDP